jgi:hypothetical protein
MTDLRKPLSSVNRKKVSELPAHAAPVVRPMPEPRDHQQVMDDSVSENEVGNLEFERRPANSERMRLRPLPNEKLK